MIFKRHCREARPLARIEWLVKLGSGVYLARTFRV